MAHINAPRDIYTKLKKMFFKETPSKMSSEIAKEVLEDKGTLVRDHRSNGTLASSGGFHDWTVLENQHQKKKVSLVTGDIHLL